MKLSGVSDAVRRVSCAVLLGLSVGGVVWGLAELKRSETRNMQVRADAALLAQSFSGLINERIAVLSVFSRGWPTEPEEDLTTFSRRTRVANLIYSDILSIARVNTQGEVVKALPEGALPVNVQVTDVSNISAQNLADLERRGQPAFAPPAAIKPLIGRWMFHLPVYRRDTLHGSVIFEFQLDNMLQEHLDSPALAPFSSKYELSATLGGQPLTARVTSRADGLVEETVDFLGQPLRVSLSPGPLFFEDRNVYAALLTGVLAGISAFFAGLFWQARKTMNRVRSTLEKSYAHNSGLKEQLRGARLGADRAERDVARAREESNKFLSTVSHEVRTPLNAIMGMFELILSQSQTDSVERKARSGLSSAQRLHRLMSNLLEHSKLRGGQLEVHPMHIPTSLLSRGWMTTIEGLISHSGHDIKAGIRICEDLPKTVFLDRERVEQIVVNLLDNAVKATKAGCVRIEMSAGGEAGDDLVIAVTDSGPGIPGHLTESIFVPFVRQSTDRLDRASGLGLSISRDLARAMNGSLAVENRPEGGARFTLVLKGAVRGAPAKSVSMRA